MRLSSDVASIYFHEFHITKYRGQHTSAAVRSYPAPTWARKVTMAEMMGTVGAMAILMLCTYEVFSSSRLSRLLISVVVD